MVGDEIAIGHSFDFELEVEELTFKEKLDLCKVLDSYELERSVEDIFVVDVIAFDHNTFVIRITVKSPMTYDEIETYLDDLMKFADDNLDRPLKMSPVSIKWNVGLYGVPSTRIDIKAMTERANRMESLKSLRVDIAQEEKKETEQQYRLEKGAAYIIKEKKAEKGFSVFHDLVTHGVPGLCITRTAPEEIKKKYGLKNTPIVWLSRREGEKIIQPTRLPQLALLIQRFLMDAKDSVVILEGVEYLITHNNFNIILKLLQNIKDDVVSSSSRLLIPIDPNALDARSMALLERDFRMM